MAYRIHGSAPTDDEVRRILIEQTHRAIRAAGDEDPHEAVHEVRRRCKKLRAALRLARPAIGRRFKRENAVFRDIGRSISQLRDAQAVVEAAASLRQRFADEVPGAIFDRADSEMLSRRDAAATPEELRSALDCATDQLRPALDRLEKLPIRGRSFAILSGGLQQTYRDCRRAMRTAHEEPSVEALHEWRKRIKDHRYHVAMLRSIWPETMTPRQEQLHRLSDLLGADHDLATLSAILQAEGLGLDLDTLMPLIGRRRAELIEEAWPLGARLFAERPKRFARRIEALWDAAGASGPVPVPAAAPQPAG